MSKHELKQGKVKVKDGAVSFQLYIPHKPVAAMTLAHGAGTSMSHKSLIELSQLLADRGLAVMRFNFLYSEQKRKMPDRPPLATAAVGAVADQLHSEFPGLPIFLSGKSFGGRMSSTWVSSNCPQWLKGIIFYGFPLHPPGKPSIERAEHLKNIGIPMLFLQGTRDALASIDLIEGVASTLDTATLVKIQDADHSFKSGKITHTDLLADTSASWIKTIL